LLIYFLKVIKLNINLMPFKIHWFKKNLRFQDNEILIKTDSSSSILLYIIEPELWIQKDMSQRQWDFIWESLKSLKTDLAKQGLHLNILYGDASEIFQKLHKKYGFTKVISEQETGIHWTFGRDKKLKSLFKELSVNWIEYPYFGVKRGNHNRDHWAGSIQNILKKPLVKKDKYIDNSIILTSQETQTPRNFYDRTPCPFRQKGGSHHAHDLLNTFLEVRGENYQKEMSSPITAEKSCSRLSPHFTHGTISLRQAFQTAEQKKLKVQSTNKVFTKSINAFLSRLYWRSHFIQKLEDEPSIELKSFITLYDEIRDQDKEKLQLWIKGETGIPFIDACMIYLRNHGWINFRMRAMLASFAAYNLWLDWRYFAPPLAALFTDFEPGIHYSQIQMQSGTTGINTIRMYNPYKQSEEQDPEANFIVNNIPSFKNVPKNLLHFPETVTPFEKQLLPPTWKDPIINVVQSSKKAKDKIYGIRKMINHKILAKSVFLKHGSRKSH